MANFTLDQTGQEIQDILDTVGNNEATQGQVLTADGNGGASWQNASGEHLYEHIVSFYSNKLFQYIYITILTTSATAMTIQGFTQWLSVHGYTESTKRLTVLGFCTNNNNEVRMSSSIQRTSLNSFDFYSKTYTFAIDDTTISISSSSSVDTIVSISRDYVTQIM